MRPKIVNIDGQGKPRMSRKIFCGDGNEEPHRKVIGTKICFTKKHRVNMKIQGEIDLFLFHYYKR
ncbi:MAG: hypothetical protein A2X60_17705 [Ignavibacteria bacterium GWF2_35_20]|nr:MAG: hypothetical protein A2006_11740 [Ignavibacteria bacterium GWC2_35_8]OGU57511.1 MAG: hypothetical protein A2X60_17705 [Ignavibacteria bacterium GWF2_35_20]OGU88192.1 MAG: hypothetical protein A2492_04070 [Ignavibacteria bacterium RIFOXYC12_FULL_35_11]